LEGRIQGKASGQFVTEEPDRFLVHVHQIVRLIQYLHTPNVMRRLKQTVRGSMPACAEGSDSAGTVGVMFEVNGAIFPGV